MTTTRRGALAAAAALVTTAAAATTAHASRPVVTVWHRLAHRADQLRVGYAVHSRQPATRRQLQRQLTELTELVADLTDALVDEHTTEVPR